LKITKGLSESVNRRRADKHSFDFSIIVTVMGI
jgi:hypothetical protein